MNPLLEEILQTRLVSDGTTTATLEGEIYPEDGRLLQRLVALLTPQAVLEVGLGYGISSLYLGEALAALPVSALHIVIDPYQHGYWHGIGLRNLELAGYDGNLLFLEEPSELVLPRLYAEGLGPNQPLELDLVFVDGYHDFDQVLVEFFYLHRLLREGGVCVFHDVNVPALNAAVRHVLTYPCYEVCAIPDLPRYRPALVAELLGKSWDEVDGVAVPVRKVSSDDRPECWYQDFAAVAREHFSPTRDGRQAATGPVGRATNGVG